jgi:ribosomal protein L37AE/L43A
MIDTEAKELRDGLNPCPKCGSTEVQQRAGTDRLVCLYCRHEWAAARVEEAYGLGEGIADLRGTQIASGARDIDADAAHLRSYHCGGCGAEARRRALGGGEGRTSAAHASLVQGAWSARIASASEAQLALAHKPRKAARMRGAERDTALGRSVAFWR